MRWMMVFVWILLAACGGQDGFSEGDTSDTDADTDSDSDADTDADTDADSDADADTDTDADTDADADGDADGDADADADGDTDANPCEPTNECVTEWTCTYVGGEVVYGFTGCGENELCCSFPSTDADADADTDADADSDADTDADGDTDADPCTEDCYWDWLCEAMEGTVIPGSCPMDYICCEVPEDPPDPEPCPVDEPKYGCVDVTQCPGVGEIDTDYYCPSPGQFACCHCYLMSDC